MVSAVILLRPIILRDPGAVSRVHKMFVVKVYCNTETSLEGGGTPI